MHGYTVPCYYSLKWALCFCVERDESGVLIVCFGHGVVYAKEKLSRSIFSTGLEYLSVGPFVLSMLHTGLLGGAVVWELPRRIGYKE